MYNSKFSYLEAEVFVGDFLEEADQDIMRESSW